MATLILGSKILPRISCVFLGIFRGTCTNMVTYVTPKAIYKSDVIREALRKWDEGVAPLHISDLASLLPPGRRGTFFRNFEKSSLPTGGFFFPPSSAQRQPWKA